MKVEDLGGTLGEQLVAAGSITDDDLTEFYRQRLLVPQVNPNTLARLPVKVIAAIPSDMAIELRAIPVSLDADNNLTVAMSDPSDRHAVDEIAFFTGAYVVRAIATQMQIAWCLAHYYGHLTALGHKLIQSTQPGVPQSEVRAEAAVAASPAPRTRGLTGKVDAARHRAIAPITGPVDVQRPNSGELDADLTPPAPLRAASEPMIAGSDGVPDQPRARSVSGEIRVPIRRAASIRPQLPDPVDGEDDDDDSADGVGEVITMEVSEPIAIGPEASDDPTGPRKVPVRKRKAKTDPPELAARVGEVEIATGPVGRMDLDEPRIIIAEDLEPPPPPPILPETSGELRVVNHRDDAAQPSSTIEVDDTSAGVIIHEHYGRESEPVLLATRRRPSDQPTTMMNRAPSAGDDPDDDVVVLDARKPAAASPPRPEKRTQVGMGAHAALTRSHRDTEASAAPAAEIDDGPTSSEHQVDVDPTRVDAQAAPPRPEDTTDETIAPPPPRSPGDDTSPRIAPPAPGSGLPTRPLSEPDPDALDDDVDDDDDDDVDEEEDTDGSGRRLTAVMSAIELDAIIPQRRAEVLPAHLESNRRIDYDPVDDGWGPPGTTIPPPLLGAIPGSEDEDSPSEIPITSVDSAPLIVAPPSPPEATRSSPVLADAAGYSLVRALEDATSRSIELIRALERASDRDAVVSLMIAHLAETHRRAGFFSIKPTATRSNELAVFAMQPAVAVLPMSSLLLDRPSTLQDVVGTRLPYRGPMHDDASRNFLASVLGACPPEILLVPVAVRERVVGVLYGEHRMRHTFDDQLALAARAAGMALERILKSKRG